jgi:hypothetical protein
LPSTTLAQYRTRIASKIGLDNSTSGDQTLIDSWVNEGYEEVMLETKARVAISTTDLTEGRENYTLPSAIMTILKITNSTNSLHMERVTMEDLIDMQENGGVSAPPCRYYAVSGANLITVYPTPGAGETLKIIYVPRPAALAASSDVPSEIPAEFHKAIEFYALREAADYDDDQSSYIGRYYDTQYKEYLKKLKRHVFMKGGSRLPTSRLNRGYRTLAHDPSQDLG